ncbi:hypothetical protein BDP55DRAFT_637001 [Colletotrichum godetiae]|uniref:Uncharacterized protein n=1 Tax=Colletotrichum godetiae TaxID=1209918 RepID=A0AAJ0AA68_9PEZI|nr:uncharacterized protein BDP55DRAFT_637001 [Colletotrichum godetiae]KAK1659379.1 hypothetical protein BDP55DRAFT_637001 [Colletotrichum godetiae]
MWIPGTSLTDQEGGRRQEEEGRRKSRTNPSKRQVDPAGLLKFHLIFHFDHFSHGHLSQPSSTALCSVYVRRFQSSSVLTLCQARGIVRGLMIPKLAVPSCHEATECARCLRYDAHLNSPRVSNGIRKCPVSLAILPPSRVERQHEVCAKDRSDPGAGLETFHLTSQPDLLAAAPISPHSLFV